VFEDQETESRLRKALGVRSELFSEEHFMNNIKRVVDDFKKKNM